MLFIGVFVQIGQVIYWMFWYWDMVGLFVFVYVDEFSGYCFYDFVQFECLYWIVVLWQFGFGFDVIFVIFEQGVDVECIGVLLCICCVEVEQEYWIVVGRFVDVERCFYFIEKEKYMLFIEIIQKLLLVVCFVVVCMIVLDQFVVVGVVGLVFDVVVDVIGEECGLLMMLIVQYEIFEDGLQVIVGYVYFGLVREGFEVVEFFVEVDVVCGIYFGFMDCIVDSWQVIYVEIIVCGLVYVGFCCEFYVCVFGDDQLDWVIELQQLVRCC